MNSGKTYISKQNNPSICLSNYVHTLDYCVFFPLDNKQIYRNSINVPAAEFKYEEVSCVVSGCSYYSKYTVTPKEVGGNFTAYPSVRGSMNKLSYEVARG